MTTQEFIFNNFDLNDYPVGGASFITPDGKYVKLRKKGHDHSSLIELLKEKGFPVSAERGYFPELQDRGFIRCNDGIDNGYAYLELYGVAPTKEQYKAIDNWATYTQKRQHHICAIILTKNDCIELHYKNFFSGRKIQQDIEEYYIYPKSTIKTVFYEKDKIISTVNEKTTIKFLSIIPTEDDIKEVCRRYEINQIPIVETEVHLHIPYFAFFGNYEERYTKEEIRTKTSILKGDEAIKFILDNAKNHI